MPAVLRIVLFGLLACASCGATAQILVVVNPQNPLTELRREQLVDLFMGRQSSFPNGGPATTLDQAADAPARAAFYQKLIGKSASEVNAYWARLRFSGRARPPLSLAPPTVLLETVRKLRESIAYIDARDDDGTAKVVLRLD